MVRFTGETEKRLKVRIKGPKTTYTYNLPLDAWTVFPLSDGNGSYQAVVYKNTSGSKYATVMTAKFEVALKDEFAPFLRPNQYVDYTDAVDTVAKAADLCQGLTHPLEKVAAVYDFVVDTLHYARGCFDLWYCVLSLSLFVDYNFSGWNYNICTV